MATDNLAIADYALLSDCRSAALVSREGSVDWLCLPRFDGPSVLARLLDDTAGHWSLRPAGAFHVRRMYVEGTMALEATFEAESGTIVLLDAMAVGPNEEGHDWVPAHRASSCDASSTQAASSRLRSSSHPGPSTV